MRVNGEFEEYERGWWRWETTAIDTQRWDEEDEEADVSKQRMFVKSNGWKW